MTTATKTVELYYVEASDCNGENFIQAEATFNREDGADLPDDAISYWEEYESLEAAVEAADIGGLGLWFTSGGGDREDAGYTGMIRVIHGAEPEYRAI